jgi:SpoOM protein
LAACNLKIQLDEPKKIRTGGELVTGTVSVLCEKDVNCKGLVVQTRWSTHGRGNVDSATVDESIAFQGEWQAGQEYRYPFKLKAAEWPPTYYGTFVNVSHTVDARAKLAWAIDPKASAEFPVVVAASPTDVQPSRKQVSHGCNWIALIILGAMAAVFAAAFFWFIPIIAFIVFVAWFFRSFLPRQLTGSIETKLEPRRVKPGDVVQGQLSFTPKWSVNINQVTLGFSGVERCVSGSGSNRKTHSHLLSQHIQQLAGAQRLAAGQKQSFDFEINIPNPAAPSMKMVDNEVLWSVVLRIDIPLWPDWTETFPLIVELGSPSDAAGRIEAAQVDSSQEEWLDQVIEQLQESRDSASLRLILEAIREHEFTIALEIEGDCKELTTQYTPEVPGKWLTAYDSRHELDVCLFVPSTMFVPAEESLWRGRVGIVDYDSEEVLYVRVLD